MNPKLQDIIPFEETVRLADRSTGRLCSELTRPNERIRCLLKLETEINCFRYQLKLHNRFIRLQFLLAVPKKFRNRLMEFRSHFQQFKVHEFES